MSGEMIEAEIERLTAERDAARDDVATLIGERNQSRIETINWQQRAETLEQAAQRLTAECDGLRVEVMAQLAAKKAIIKERDIAEKDREQARAEVCYLKAERDAAREELERVRAENEGLRADLLAHPPQRIDFQQYVALKADHEQQAATIEALQEALRRTEAILEESQDKGATLMRRAESDHQIILGLRECLERTEKRLTQAKARQIPPALVGLLGVIRREAAAAEKMIL